MQNESKLSQQGPFAKGPLGGKNVWPPQLPLFKSQLMNYYSAMTKLSSHLITAFSVAMGLSQEQLSQYFTDPNIFLRLLYYPPIPQHAPVDLFSAAPHTDYGCITLLVQDDTGGLQVESPDKKWIDVPCLAIL